MSDEELATILNSERKRFPDEFKSISSGYEGSSQNFLRNTSANTIYPLLKWL